ncbi:MAG TPA: S-methyl-5-thioribose-1-phosphate isomerase [Burkholderiales bacterium]|nr:S-methyl-5-thioribose-1-phosphate isomerase [Burkholderiales bacterium]
MSPPNKVETLRWRNNKLEMIDQRILPKRFEYVTFDSAAAVADGIRSMVVRGAPAIGCAAAYGIALEAQRLQRLPEKDFVSALEKSFTELGLSRPTAVNLFWALQRMREVWTKVKHQNHVLIAQKLLIEAKAIQAEDLRVNRAMGKHGAALIKDNARILTYCNAGTLATAGHGTALGIIRSAVEAGNKVSVFTAETRPLLQGARLTAWELVEENIPVTLITDNMAGHLMSRGEIDVVVVGTDRVAANGDVANKIGTYMLAVLAQRHHIPFYVACPLSSIDLGMANGAAIPIEERSASEILGFRRAQWAAEGVKVRNPAFDVTPAELVTGLITEKGVVLSPNRENLKKLFEGQNLQTNAKLYERRQKAAREAKKPELIRK